MSVRACRRTSGRHPLVDPSASSVPNARKTKLVSIRSVPTLAQALAELTPDATSTTTVPFARATRDTLVIPSLGVTRFLVSFQIFYGSQ